MVTDAAAEDELVKLLTFDVTGTDPALEVTVTVLTVNVLVLIPVMAFVPIATLPLMVPPDRGRYAKDDPGCT